MRDLGTGVLPLGATHRRPRDWAGALQPGRQTYLPISPHISPHLALAQPGRQTHLAISRHLSPSLPISLHISPNLALQPGRQTSLRLERSSAGRPDRRLSLAAAPARGRPLAARPLRGLGRPVSPRGRGDAGCPTRCLFLWRAAFLLLGVATLAVRSPRGVLFLSRVALF